ALMAAAVLATSDPTIAEVLDDFRARQTDAVLADPDPRD
ncbi:MAG: 5-(carboxyamino)imidazole ribonucleotide mutase, partial [Gammaproteobacteria bacterium]|nr:5-(carboxyamino)imidazole ribonucleotide mutase [Gammaproteobacteria bacterium]